LSIFIIVAVVLSVFLALNIGANNAAASMATSYGAGVRTKRQAVILIAVFALLGAIIAGAPVVNTMGKGIVPSDVLSNNPELILIVLLIAIVFISWANIAKIPIATTHAIVCAIAGIGLYANSLNTDKLYNIITWWIAAPIVAFLINYIIAKYFYFKIIHYLASNFPENRVNAILTIFITFTGIFIAFSGGANNSANAVGPLVGLGILTSTKGAIIAGIAMGVGAILFGGRVLETLGKEITEICIIRAISVEFTGATIILAASFYGIPVSIAEIITSGIIGFSCAQHGFGITAQNRHVVRIAFFWFVIPFVAIGLSYALSSLYFSYGFAEAINLNIK